MVSSVRSPPSVMACYFSLFLLVCLTTVCRGESENKFSQSVNQFTVDWLKTLSKSNEENVLISPVAVGAVLGMVQLGAKGNSAAELEKTLHLNGDEAKEGYRALKEKIKGEKVHVELEWGSGGYIRKDLELNEEFRKNVLENFGAEINNDFPDAELAAARLNDEVSNITKGLIKDLFTPSVVKDAAALFYSAIYFKGKWFQPFKRSHTENDKFYVTAESAIDDVPFMEQVLRAKSGECTDLGAKWVQLNYDDPNYSMLIVLPIQRHGLNAVIEKMTDADLQSMIGSEDIKRIRLVVPKFQLSQKESVVGSLKQLGLNDIFTNQADLTGISSSSPPLAVSDIIQQVNVDVDEDGSTAAAAVGAVFFPLSFEVNPDVPLEFKADEPFLFFIVHKTDKIPLFVGKVVKPKI